MQQGEVPSSPLTISFQNRVSMGSKDHRAQFGPPEITPNDIELHELIGVGSYGSVYRARCRGLEVAVKIPLNQNLTALQVVGFMDEVRMMSKNTHPNIISLLGACVEPGKLQIVTERCTRDLANLLADKLYKGTLHEQLRLAYEIAKGMWWLHESSKIIHGDLKPANILLDVHTKVKITDFGFSLFKQDQPIEAPSAKGSLFWMAPEKIQRKPITEKIDVYSFGIILWEILTRQKPFQHHADPQQFCIAVCFENERPPIPQDIPPDLKELLINCWHQDPTVRYSFKQIVHILSSIMVDISFELSHAAAFWKRNFIQDEEYREEVEWDIFKRALKHTTGEISDELYNGLKELLVEIVSNARWPQETVTMKRFDKISKWFSGFFRDSGQSQIAEINTLVAELWFHGDIDGTFANARLSGKPNGTFLIRLSSTDPQNAPFTLSLPNNCHYHIKRSPTGFRIHGHDYTTLQQLIIANSALLKTPCRKYYDVRYPNDPSR